MRQSAKILVSQGFISIILGKLIFFTKSNHLNMTNHIIASLKTLLASPNLASKKWIYQQYDSQVMNDTIQTGGDAAIVRVHNTNKALAITSDCTPRYVEADPFEGAKQAVVETYRNISAVGATPMAITNCLNFGNPQKPEIMGQIVRSIKGINQACEFLNYPVVSGNVSLYNETDGNAIKPTPTIGGVGLLKDLNKRCDINFKNIGDAIFVIGKTSGHLDCSLYQKEILQLESKNNPPPIDLGLEKKHSQFIIQLIEESLINACHDISDGGLLVTLFEMCNQNTKINPQKSQFLGCQINNQFLKQNIDQQALLFGEDQGRYIISVEKNKIDLVLSLTALKQVEIYQLGEVIADKIIINDNSVNVEELQNLNQQKFSDQFS